MIRAIRQRLDARADEGFSLIEVIVAMFIFGLIATGVIYSMMQVLVVTRDSRARQVAANLAAQEIDFVRDVEDVFAVTDAPGVGDPAREVSLNSEVYTITRTADWVTNPEGELETCGAGGGTLKYKSVTVTVEWGSGDNRRSVESTTLLNPNERLNDPTLGTIMVSVADLNGAGIGSIAVSARASGSPSGTLYTGTTDSQGCAYLLRIPPGTYDVEISTGGGYIDVNQDTTPSKSASVIAGASVASSFTIAVAGNLDVDFVADGVDVPSSELPANMHATTISTYGVVAVENNGASTMPVYPFPDGYAVVAGDTTQCEAIDPQWWPEDAAHSAGERQPVVTVAPGGTQSIDIPVRRVSLSGFATYSGSWWGGSWSSGDRNRYITAVPVNPDAECAVNGSGTPYLSYRFNSLSNSANSATIALPYGVWQLYTGTSAGSTSTLVTSSRITVTGGDSLSGTTIVLDPRAP
ncbi:prepilin-type N-terminal cleavage/methylation domain-containing protein [Salinibacterium sp. SYSU T00001]|uniref:prepilin-type N-terminal cleavage/methylation domain-containing protein n=1 Tax=Homoserinimonas sedimenticola TaxID=2986805 RepID=UPI0022359308|nr:prepilin-type N-terminal cleavage/methylation domain-containing protein [Salinibacterium sedimenticola]MCW4385333.1 prepilin-type N-terminal cleavage/methylation domain-containing protein [Salinibacterium sedimenticola]